MARVVAMAQVADVVEQRGDDSHAEQLRSDGLGARASVLVAIHEPRHRQRHIQHVLQVVVLGIAPVIPRELAAVQAPQVGECARHDRGRGHRIQIKENAADLAMDGGDVGAC